MRGYRTGLFGSLEDTRAIAVVCDRRRVAIGSRQPSARLERIVRGRNLDDKAAHFAVQPGISGMRPNGETASHCISAIQTEKLTQCDSVRGIFRGVMQPPEKSGTASPPIHFRGTSEAVSQGAGPEDIDWIGMPLSHRRAIPNNAAASACCPIETGPTDK